MTDALINAIAEMRNSPIRNYIAPGLTSWLVGGNGCGKVRMFTTDRDTREWITPHSHRFNFTCLVLRGSVTNILFERSWNSDEGNLYAVGILKARGGGLGGYEYLPEAEGVKRWKEIERRYGTGDTYSMTASQIHTIRFDRDAAVLFFEGPELTDHSVVLEPYSDNRRVPTFVTQPWMFERCAQTQESKP